MKRTSPTGQWRSGRPRRPMRLPRLLVGLLLTQVPALWCPAQPPKPTEDDVKAAYLINFGKFVRRSVTTAPRSSFDICLVGRDGIGPSLDSLAANSTVDNLPVHIEHLADVSATKSCAIVFLSSTEGDRIREDLAILGNSDILTVSDARDFLERGGMIQFILVSNHVRFSVNLDAVSRTHLVLSSELLRVAASVSGKPSTGELP
jgi:hypothetical protein